MAKHKNKDDLEKQVEELNVVRLAMYRFFLKMGLDEEEAIQISLYIEDMASINTTARLEAKIDALREMLETKIEAQNSKYAILIWVIGAGVTLLIASNFIGGGGV